MDEVEKKGRDAIDVLSRTAGYVRSSLMREGFSREEAVSIAREWFMHCAGRKKDPEGDKDGQINAALRAMGTKVKTQ